MTKNLINETFKKHLKLLHKKLKLNEHAYMDEVEDVKDFFKSLKSDLSSKNVDYNKFIETVKAGEEFGPSWARQAVNGPLPAHDLNDFKYDIQRGGGDEIYNYDDEVVEYILSVFKKWNEVSDDYKQKERKAGKDMDARSMLDMHPGLDFKSFMDLAEL